MSTTNAQRDADTTATTTVQPVKAGAAATQSTEELSKHPGCYLPPPPCCEEQCTMLREYGEDSRCCVVIGKAGLADDAYTVNLCVRHPGCPPERIPRHKLMYAAFSVSFIGLVFMIIAACAISTDPEVVKKIADRRVPCTVCPISNHRAQIVPRIFCGESPIRPMWVNGVNIGSAL